MQATNQQAVTFLQQCKRIYARTSDLQHLQALQSLQEQGNWNDALLDSYAYFYCYRTGLTVEELCAITCTLQEEFDMDGNLDVLHLQTQDELDGWIAQLL